MVKVSPPEPAHHWAQFWYPIGEIHLEEKRMSHATTRKTGPTPGRRSPAMAILLLLLLTPVKALAADSSVGFIAVAAAPDQLGPEARAAWNLAAKDSGTSLIVVSSDGQFINLQGQDVNLSQFRVLWHHEGDTSQQTTIHGPRSFPMLRKYVTDGGSLFLSGAALSLVHTMGIEPVAPRTGNGGRDRYSAKLIPVQTKHPIFNGVISTGNVEGGPITITSEGFPAYADFHGSGGPTAGMLLGRAASGQENPLVEYQLGKGRIIVMGWRLPHYAHAANVHRANLERLTHNILAYLGDPRQWQPIVIQPAPAAAAAKAGVSEQQWTSLQLAIRDLTDTFKERYPRGEEYIRRLEGLRKAVAPGKSQPATFIEAFNTLRYKALLDNPLLDFDRLILIERGAGKLGLPANWESNSSLGVSGFQNRLCLLSPIRPEGTLTELYQPDGGRFVGDLDLHFDATRLLFSMPGSNGRWQIHELKLDSAAGSAPAEMTLIHEPDVDNYDACYLPDGRIIFSSTAPYIGVPCVYGASHIANLYLRHHDGSIRQLTVDQEHNWCPRVLPDGRVL
jgi:hypothetical protein